MKLLPLYKLLVSVLALLFWSADLCANDSDPFPEVNPYAYYGNMSVTVKAVKGGEVLQNVVVAVYCGDELRSKGVPTSSSKPGVVYLTVYGNRSGEQLTFRVFDTSDGMTYQINEVLKYKFNGTKGSPRSPYELVIDDADILYGCITVSGKNEDLEVLIDGNKLENNILTTPVSAHKVTYKRTFTTPYATICLPFDVNASDAAAAGRFYKFSGINENYEVEMVEETLGLTANTPYIVQPASMDDEVLFVYNGEIDFPLAATPETTDSNEHSNWAFKGSWNEKRFKGTPANKAIYFFAASQQGNVSPGDFVKVNTEGENTRAISFRAYLEYNGDGNLSMSQNAPRRTSSRTTTLPKSMRVIIVNRDGPITEIGTVFVGDNDIWYNLDGRKIEGQPETEGLFIHNGRKVLIKNK